MLNDKLKTIEQILNDRYGNNPDPWGLDPHKALNDLKMLWPVYRYYFDVKLHGAENIDSTKPYMVVSNHTGQIPIDALLICTAFLMDIEHPRILRPLVERFLNSLPFLGKWSQEAGAVLGDRNNCINLIKRQESILIFPEGVSGIAKSPHEFYRMKNFTRGFLRMALHSKVDILPIAVVGAEEFYPFVMHFPKIAKLLKLPAIPLSPNLIPLPSPVDIYIGKSYKLPDDLKPDISDEELNPHIHHIEEEINKMLQAGLAQKRTIQSRFLKL
jgi:1-acyl-sn-glycerol-3-phosphate acyltransferase